MVYKNFKEEFLKSGVLYFSSLPTENINYYVLLQVEEKFKEVERKSSQSSLVPPRPDHLQVVQ